MIKIGIQGSSFYSDFVGRLSDGRIACLSIVGRKTGVDRALIELYRGSDIVIDSRIKPTLGEKAYRVYKCPLGANRIAKAYIMPSDAIASLQNASRQSASEVEGDEAKSAPPVLIWRKTTENQDDSRIWAYIRQHSPVPMLDDWCEPIMRRLKALTANNDASGQLHGAIDPITFNPCHDGRWRGAAVRVTEMQVKHAVWEALVSGDATVPA